MGIQIERISSMYSVKGNIFDLRWIVSFEWWLVMHATAIVFKNYAEGQSRLHTKEPSLSL